MGSAKYSLRWNNHPTQILSAFEGLLVNETLVDVTLVCQETTFKAHKVVLSACRYVNQIFSLIRGGCGYHHHSPNASLIWGGGASNKIWRTRFPTLGIQYTLCIRQCIRIRFFFLPSSDFFILFDSSSSFFVLYFAFSRLLFRFFSYVFNYCHRVIYINYSKSFWIIRNQGFFLPNFTLCLHVSKVFRL